MKLGVITHQISCPIGVIALRGKCPNFTLSLGLIHREVVDLWGIALVGLVVQWVVVPGEVVPGVISVR